MGLAASQARLLTITSRKADCEFQSMTLSHQKLSLSRDMEAVSTAYQNALSLTKLVYDYQGQNSAELDLSYGLLMTPSIYNDYYPKLVTDNKDRVILSGAYATAARAAGIPAEGLLGTPSSDVRNKFIQALATTNIISASNAASIQAITYKNSLGLGNTISISTSYEDLTYDDLLNRIKASCESTNGYGLALGSGGARADGSSAGNLSSNERFYVCSEGNWTNFEAGTDTSKSTGDLTLYDLLSGNAEYYLSMLSRKGDELPVLEASYLQERIAGTGGILDWMVDQFTTVLGGSVMNDTALQYAYNQVYDMIVPNNNIIDWCNNNRDKLQEDKGKRQQILEPENETLLNYMKEIGEYEGTKGVRDHSTDRTQKSDNYLGFYFTGDKNQSWTHKDRNDKSQISINLNNIADAFLTSYVQYIQGVENSEYDWDKGAISASNLYDGTKDKDFVFTVPSESEIDNGDNDVYAAFYDTLFNMLCTKGWVENAQIDSKEYMGEMLKNGMAYISSISDDGFYYQSTYSNDKLVREVTDDEAIARAEAQYNTEKTRIENKEQTLDMKMKNLDTEISSLTQEYETVKSLVTKSIEKSFKRYDA